MARPNTPNNTRISALVSRNMYRSLLSAHVRFLNLRANMGNSEFMSIAVIIDMIRRDSKPIFVVKSVSVHPIGITAQLAISGWVAHTPRAAHISALAGTGSPKNECDCRVSILNLASRYALAAGISNARYDHSTSPCSSKIRYKMNAGATPEVTTSASESNSFPRGEDTPNARAANPSQKSKKMPRQISTAAIRSFPSTADHVAHTPQVRLSIVIVLGISFLIARC